jgi:hypothetical protein
MKKLLIILTILGLGLSLQAQKLSHQNQVLTFNGQMLVHNEAAESGDYPSVLDEDSTKGWWIAEAQYITEDVGVTTWADKSGYGEDLTVTADDSEPSFSDDSIYFDGVDDYLSVDITDIPQPFTIYIVASRHSLDTTFFSSDGSTSRFYQPDGDPEMWCTFGSFIFIDGSDWPINTWAVFKTVVNGASSEIRFNNLTADTGNLGTNSLVTFQISGYDTTNEQMELSVREIIIRAADDSSGDDDIIVSYLNTKYSIY